MNHTIGRLRWVIAEGYIPPKSHGPAPEFTSHEAFCVLNANSEDAHLRVTVFTLTWNRSALTACWCRPGGRVISALTIWMIPPLFRWEPLIPA